MGDLPTVDLVLECWRIRRGVQVLPVRHQLLWSALEPRGKGEKGMPPSHANKIMSLC